MCFLSVSIGIGFIILFIYLSTCKSTIIFEENCSLIEFDSRPPCLLDFDIFSRLNPLLLPLWLIKVRKVYATFVWSIPMAFFFGIWDLTDTSTACFTLTIVSNCYIIPIRSISFSRQMPWRAGYYCRETAQKRDANDIATGRLIKARKWSNFWWDIGLHPDRV